MNNAVIVQQDVNWRPSLIVLSVTNGRTHTAYSTVL